MTPRARLWRRTRAHARERAAAAAAREPVDPAPAPDLPPPTTETPPIPVADPEPFALRADAASDTAVDFQYEVFGATARATVTRTTARRGAAADDYG